MAAIQGFEQILLYQMAAASHVDQRGALGQLLEQFAVENPLGLLGQRQGAEQDVALAEEDRKLIGTGEAIDAGDLVPAASPTGQGESIGLQGGEYLPSLKTKA
ncbi:hypothetical protein D3C76_1441110 [compost metagenome]